jgi:hypothetical protein
MHINALRNNVCAIGVQLFTPPFTCNVDIKLSLLTANRIIRLV